MIVVTKLNGTHFAVNPDLIERIYATPDTTLVMVDGSKYIVTETSDIIIEKIAQWRARVLAVARDLPVTMSEPAVRPLGVLHSVDGEQD